MAEKEPKWFQFWKRANKEQVKAINNLVTAIYDLEKARIEGNKEINQLLSDPERFASFVQRAMGTIPGVGVAAQVVPLVDQPQEIRLLPPPKD